MERWREHSQEVLQNSNEEILGETSLMETEEG
jgi:hypothetical protein